MACERPRPAWFRNDRKGRPVFREPLGGDQADYYRGVLPCNECTECLARRARDWSIRVTHEASMWPENCFLTLTYDRQHLPVSRGLEKRDFVLFMKRLRFEIHPTLIRFLAVGEYGHQGGRPHYHGCVFNYAFHDLVGLGQSSSGHAMFRSQMLERIWGKGRCVVQELNAGTACYCAQYCMKKCDEHFDPKHRRWRIGQDGVLRQLEPEFLLSSRRPGIGRRWIEKYSRDVYREDRGTVVFPGGRELPAPAAYDRWYEGQNPEGFARMKLARQEAAWADAKDSTPRRLAVRAFVAAAGRRARSAF